MVRNLSHWGFDGYLMAAMLVISVRILSGSLDMPVLTMSTTFFRVLHCPISMSMARSVMARRGDFRISVLAFSRSLIASSIFAEHPRASPFRTRSDAAHTFESAWSLDARGSNPLAFLMDWAASLKLLAISAKRPGVVSVSSLELFTIIA